MKFALDVQILCACDVVVHFPSHVLEISMLSNVIKITKVFFLFEKAIKTIETYLISSNRSKWFSADSSSLAIQIKLNSTIAWSTI